MPVSVGCATTGLSLVGSRLTVGCTISLLPWRTVITRSAVLPINAGFSRPHIPKALAVSRICGNCDPSLLYDAGMTSRETPPKSRGLEEIVLWMVIGLCLALGAAWETYPRIYKYSHYPHGTGSSYTWKEEGRGTDPLVKFSFFACLIAAPGFTLLGFSRRFPRDTPKILLRVFLLAGIVMASGMWTFALANHFWTLQHSDELREAEPYMHAGSLLFRVGFWSAIATSLSNMVFVVVLRRRV
jgi:hypothetical protein